MFVKLKVEDLVWQTLKVHIPLNGPCRPLVKDLSLFGYISFSFFTFLVLLLRRAKLLADGIPFKDN
jgi:hypothetical protein